MQDPSGDEMRLPTKAGFASSLNQLTEMVVSQISSFDKVTDNGYSKKLRESAAKQNLAFSQYMSKLVEHQICLRQPNSTEFCWGDGFGDEVHKFFTKIDGWFKDKPRLMQGIGTMATQIATKLATGTAKHKFSECSTCGGTKVLSKNKDNLGRAGKLNRR